METLSPEDRYHDSLEAYSQGASMVPKPQVGKLRSNEVLATGRSSEHLPSLPT